MDKTDSDPQYTIESLSEIRDNALILSLGNAYLCEDQFLIKIGSIIDLNVKKLSDEISSLKKKFPGKFTKEVDTDEILEGIYSTAQNLQNPDKELNERCTVGELGRDLEAKIKSLTNAIDTIRDQVEGGGLTYTKKDSVLNVFGGFNNIGTLIGDTLKVGLKILICVIVLAILAVSYLFLTMEKEKDFLKDITMSEAYIRSQRATLSKLDQDREQISQKLKSIEEKEKKNLFRQDKIEIMDLEMEIHKIGEERRMVEVEISIHEEKIMDNQEKIEELKNKSFIKRLLKQ